MRRRWLLWIVLLAVIFLIITRFTSLRDLAATLAQGQWPWLLAAFLLHILYFILYAVLYHFGFRTVVVESRLRELVPLVFAAVLVNQIAPFGGAASVALFVDDAMQRGQSGVKAATGTVLVLVADLLSTVPFLAYGLYYLAQRHVLASYDILVTFFYLTFTFGLIGAILLAGLEPGLLHRALCRLQGVVNRIGRRFRRPRLLSEEWAEKSTRDFKAAAEAIARHPLWLGLTLLQGGVASAVNMAGLYTIFLAFGQPVTLGTLIVGYSMGFVVFVISVIPEDIAAIEAIMVVVFTRLGIPGSVAVAATLVYRGFSFWIPLLLGLFFLRRVRTFNGREERP